MPHEVTTYPGMTPSSLADLQGLTLLDFTAAWCPPCRALTPTLAQLAGAYGERVRLMEIDVDDHLELAAHFGVRAMPTVILWRDSREVGRFVGLQSRRFIQGVIDRALAGDEAIASP